MCTAMVTQTSQGDIYFGRTMDFSYPLEPELYVVPKGYQWNNIMNTHQVRNRYRFMGIGQEIILSALEYRLFLVFLNRQGEVLTRNRLLEEIWDIAGDYVNDNTLTVYIKRLRDKIEKDPAHPEIIETVRGRGYKVG